MHPQTALITALSLSTALAASEAEADVVISSDATQKMTCSAGVCQPTAKNAVLNVTDLQNLLASGNVTVTTTGSGVQAGSLNVKSAVSWSNSSALALDAYQSLIVNQPIAIGGLSGLSLTTNDGGNDGVLLFLGNGHFNFANPSSSLSINGGAYTLESTVPALGGAIAANPSGDYALASNYDASQDGIYTTAPISTSFTGIFEGLGNSISNLSIMDSGHGNVGFFGIIGVYGGAAGIVRDINLRNADVSGSYLYSSVGILAGTLQTGTIENCSTSGSVISTGDGDDNAAGGLVGSTLTVTATILNSSSSASVSASTYTNSGNAGGLVGSSAGIISESNAAGPVQGYNAGGLVGLNGGGNNQYSIDQSFATGNASAVWSAGGLIGIDEAGAVMDSYSRGMAAAGYAAGGFSGLMATDVSTSYSTGKVQAKIRKEGGGFAVAIDRQHPYFNSAFWDTTTSKYSKKGVGMDRKATGVTGLTTQQLQSGLPSGFDPSVWAEDPKINNGLPYLINNPPPK